ncbi:MAG: hypothetical protein EXR79_09815 [Myxococcales bacterium]|nr:hypothetical protein [Myxococcales bacterium]
MRGAPGRSKQYVPRTSASCTNEGGGATPGPATPGRGTVRGGGIGSVGWGGTGGSAARQPSSRSTSAVQRCAPVRASASQPASRRVPVPPKFGLTRVSGDAAMLAVSTRPAVRASDDTCRNSRRSRCRASVAASGRVRTEVAMRRLHSTLALSVLALAAHGCMFKSDHLKLLDDQKSALDRDAATSRATSIAAEQKRCADEKSAYEAVDATREAALVADHDRTKKALADLTAKGGDCAKSLVACQADANDSRSKLERVTASIAKVRDALKVMSDAGKLQVKVARGFLVISMSGDILFDSSKFELKEEAKAVLSELAGVLKSMPDRLFQVAGHTDNAGADDLNWKLSMQRALSVVQFLIKTGGIDGRALSAGGYGPFQPVADNSQDGGRQSNRRVEFLLIPNLTELLNVK